jgi:hypothetical protein
MQPNGRRGFTMPRLVQLMNYQHLDWRSKSLKFAIPAAWVHFWLGSLMGAYSHASSICSVTLAGCCQVHSVSSCARPVGSISEAVDPQLTIGRLSP